MAIPTQRCRKAIVHITPPDEWGRAVTASAPPQPRICCAHLIGCAIHQLPYDAGYAPCTCPVGIGSIRHEARLSAPENGTSLAP